jgi:hypothetical protein
MGLVGEPPRNRTGNLLIKSCPKTGVRLGFQGVEGCKFPQKISKSQHFYTLGAPII